MEEMGLPDFSGKVVLFYMRNAPAACDSGTLLEYLRLEKRGDRIFVVGRIPQLQGLEWVGNCQAAIEWDAVVHYIEFKSMEDYVERAGRFKPTLMEKLKGK